MQWWKRREAWLGTLSVALVAILYNQLSALLIPSLPPELLSKAGAAGEGRRPGVPEAVPEVKLDALASARSGYDPRGRNLFQYGQRVPPPPPPPLPEDVRREQERLRMEEEEQRRRVEEIVRQRQADDAAKLAQQQALQPQVMAGATGAPGGAAPPAPDYQFVGYMGKPKDKIAVLLHDGEVVLVKEGERLGDNFIVRQIKFESVELGYTDPRFQGQKTLLPMGN
jgi:hypothetical protein